MYLGTQNDLPLGPRLEYIAFSCFHDNHLKNTLMQPKPLSSIMYGAHNKPSIDTAIEVVVSEEHEQQFWTKSNYGPVTSTSPPSTG